MNGDDTIKSTPRPSVSENYREFLNHLRTNLKQAILCRHEVKRYEVKRA